MKITNPFCFFSFQSCFPVTFRPTQAVHGQPKTTLLKPSLPSPCPSLDLSPEKPAACPKTTTKTLSEKKKKHQHQHAINFGAFVQPTPATPVQVTTSKGFSSKQATKHSQALPLSKPPIAGKETASYHEVTAGARDNTKPSTLEPSSVRSEPPPSNLRRPFNSPHHRLQNPAKSSPQNKPSPAGKALQFPVIPPIAEIFGRISRQPASSPVTEPPWFDSPFRALAFWVVAGLHHLHRCRHWSLPTPELHPC